MKRVLQFLFMTILTIIIAACGSTAISETPMASNNSVAAISYVSSGMIDAEVSLLEEEEGDSYFPTKLSKFTMDKPGTTTTKVEGEIGYVNIYLDKFKVFMQNEGFDAMEVTVSETSDKPEYEVYFSYEVESEVYHVYYNYDEELDLYEGILIVNEVTYDLEIEDHLKEEEGETKRNMILTATNDQNTITIDYEQKEEQGESKETMLVSKQIDGVSSEIEIEMKTEEGEFKVQIKDGENYYNFKAETTDEGMHYKLDYTVDGIEGTAKIDETMNEDGEYVYSYKITEGNVEVTVEKEPPGQTKDKTK